MFNFPIPVSRFNLTWFFIYIYIFTCVTISLFALKTEYPKPFLFPINGTYNHPISSKSTQAQEYFNQGMIFLYGYNFDESARSFHEAARLDPDCAICYWGNALALRNLNASLGKLSPQTIESIQKAQSLIQYATPRERAYVNALANSYLPNQNSLKSLDQAFMDEMKKVSEQYPEDLDAVTLFAKAEMDTNPANKWEGVQNKLANVLSKDPNHPGANHYYIHAVGSSHPNYGLASAGKLEYLFPFVGHLLHMPAHIYFKMGEYHKATIANVKAVQADEDFFAKEGVKQPYFSTYYLHNLQFLIATLVMEGKKDEALQVSQKINDIIKDKNLPLSLYSTNALSAQKILILQRFNLESIIGKNQTQNNDLENINKALDQIMREPKPGTPFGNGMFHFSRSLVYLARNDPEKAKIEATAILEERVDKEEDRMNTLLMIVFLNARAAIEEREGNQTKMLQNYREAINLEYLISHFEPPLWFISSKEALGFALLRLGKPLEAKKMFTEDLKKNPKKPWSLNGLKQ